LAARTIVDIPTLVIAICTCVALLKLKVPEPVVIVLAGLVGLGLRRAG
jgi:hypothetical protein